MRLRSSNVTVAAAMVTAVALAGCAGGLDPGVSFTGTGGTGSACVPSGAVTTPPATFATVKMAMFGPQRRLGVRLGSLSRRRRDGAPGQSPDVAAGREPLHNMMTYVSHACGDIPLVNPGKPDQSALIKILTGPCGNTIRMPFGCSGDQCLSDAEVAAISAWIANCAPQQ